MTASRIIVPVAVGAILLLLVGFFATNSFDQPEPAKAPAAISFDDLAAKRGHLVALRDLAPDIFEQFEAAFNAEMDAYCGSYDCGKGLSRQQFQQLAARKPERVLVEFFNRYHKDISNMPEQDARQFVELLLEQLEHLQRSYSAKLCRVIMSKGTITLLRQSPELLKDEKFMAQTDGLNMLFIKAASLARSHPGESSRIKKADFSSVFSWYEAQGGDLMDIATMKQKSADPKRICAASVLLVKSMLNADESARHAIYLELISELMEDTLQ